MRYITMLTYNCTASNLKLLTTKFDSSLCNRLSVFMYWKDPPLRNSVNILYISNALLVNNCKNDLPCTRMGFHHKNPRNNDHCRQDYKRKNSNFGMKIGAQNDPRNEKTDFWHMQKQRLRTGAQ